MSERDASRSTTDVSATSRRQMLRYAVAGVAAAAAGTNFGFPAILRATDKAGTKPIILGSGDHTYEWVDNWAKLPDGKKFGNCHAVVEAEDGRIFVHNMSPTGDATCIFDPDGKFISSWGKQFAPGAHGMDYRKENGTEYLYLAPTSLHKIFKTTMNGEVLMELDYPKVAKNDKGEFCYQDGPDTKKGKTKEKTAGEFFVPTFIALAPNGDFYVTDGYGAGYIHRYNLKGEYQQTFGGKGDADDKTACPHGIYCDTRNPERPIIVVADREHHRLQYFTLDGKLDHLVTNETPEQKSGKDDNGMLRRPCHFHQRGQEMVVPDLRGRVTILDKSNKPIVQLGDNEDEAKRANNRVPQADTRPGQFCTPHGATFDRHGNIYVAEWLPYGRVTKLKKVDA